MLAITVAATKSYLYAWPQCIRAIASSAWHIDAAHFILATDESKEAKAAAELARHEPPPANEPRRSCGRLVNGRK